ncbi:helix-turn-helix domain-containing protein, partial [Nocardia carnea]|uniref:helix-turn-helix domain-containing protein n=1 Tax=Nocardia carnea TaxID=37328 RepID=UPI002458C8D7
VGLMIVDWTGTEVRALRTVALRCTQQEFAEITGFSEAAVRNWERRGRTITLAGQFAAGWIPC